MNTNDLGLLRAAAVNDRDVNDLVDIGTLQIEPSKDKVEKILKYFVQVGNPYLFRVGGTVVRVAFAENGATLQDAMVNALVKG